MTDFESKTSNRVLGISPLLLKLPMTLRFRISNIGEQNSWYPIQHKCVGVSAVWKPEVVRSKVDDGRLQNFGNSLVYSYPSTALKKFLRRSFGICDRWVLSQNYPFSSVNKTTQYTRTLFKKSEKKSDFRKKTEKSQKVMNPLKKSNFYLNSSFFSVFWCQFSSLF